MRALGGRRGASSAAVENDTDSAHSDGGPRGSGGSIPSPRTLRTRPWVGSSARDRVDPPMVSRPILQVVASPTRRASRQDHRTFGGACHRVAPDPARRRPRRHVRDDERQAALLCQWCPARRVAPRVRTELKLPLRVGVCSFRVVERCSRPRVQISPSRLSRASHQAEREAMRCSLCRLCDPGALGGALSESVDVCPSRGRSRLGRG